MPISIASARSRDSSFAVSFIRVPPFFYLYIVAASATEDQVSALYRADHV